MLIGFKRRRGVRWAALAVLVALSAGVLLLAFQDLQSRRSALLHAKGAALWQLGRLAEVSLRSEQALRSAELRQLRAELRSRDLWKQAFDSGLADGAEDEDADADDGNEERQGRRGAASRELASLLRRALEASEGVSAFQLLVADEQGISSRRFDGETTVPSAGRSRTRDAGGNAADRVEDLWYADDVRRAVVAVGRRVESGPLTWESKVEGRPSRAGYRRTIALHDSDELVQGVLVAELDPSSWLAALAALPGSTGTLELRSVDGRSLVDAADEMDAADRLAFAWAAQAGRETAGSEVFESGGQLVAGGVLAAGAVGGSDLIWLARTAAPASLGASVVRSPWSLALGVLMLAIGVSGWGLGLDPRRAAPEASDSVAPASSDDRIAAREPAEVHSTHSSAWVAPGAEGAQDAAADEEAESITVTRPGQPSGESEAAADAADLEESENGSEEADSSRPSRSWEGTAETIPAVVGPELFVLRDWLSDVRSCLEREAARRGLTLEMRCARALPAEIESDPVGLGALLLALGRDALDGTAGDGISIDVLGGADADLRFELDVGDGAIVPPPDLGTFAAALGAEIEQGSDRRVALVLARTLH